MWNKTIGHVVFLILAKDSTEETHICEKEEVVISLKRRKEMGKWERNISIQELIWKVVLSWRTIILSAVIVAVVATSLRYVSDMREYKVSAAGNNLAGASSQFSEEELGQIEEARLLQKRMAEMRTYMEKMKKYMSTDGTEVVSGNNVCYDVEALRRMSDVGRIVLIEKAGTSIHREIEQKINRIKEQDGNIFGCVVIK